MKTIILASNNKNKLKEMSDLLRQFSIEVVSQSEAGYNIEVEETGKTFEENAILKAEAIYKETKKPVISDDSGLEIDALDGKPGVYSARYAGPNATNEQLRKKVLNQLQNVEDKNRTARFKCSICYIDKNGEKHIFNGVSEGKIAKEEIGENGFGYDPIFLYDKRTFAQMSLEEKNKVSHRGRALQKFVQYLENEYKNI